MPKVHGRTLAVPLGRRIVDDFLAVSMSAPTVTIQKDMNVADLASARARLKVRPSWMSIFAKAYGKVVAARPELRRAFLTFPWQRIFEYARASADIVIEASLDGEPTLLTVPMGSPAKAPLAFIDWRLTEAKKDPITRVRRFRRAMTLARLPAFLRRWAWWFLTNVSGTNRSRYFGSFGVTSVGNWGVESLRPLSPWITLLHFGAIDADGRVSMRLTYDHRVLDGSAPSLALLEFEKTLHTDMFAELRELADSETPATPADSVAQMHTSWLGLVEDAV